MRGFFDHEILGPGREVLEIKPQVVRFGEDVKVDVVETEEVLAGEATQGDLHLGEGGGEVFVCGRERKGMVGGRGSCSMTLERGGGRFSPCQAP